MWKKSKSLHPTACVSKPGMRGTRRSYCMRLLRCVHSSLTVSKENSLSDTPPYKFVKLYVHLRSNSWTKSSQKSFPPCYSPLQLFLQISISSNSRNLLQLLVYTVKEKGGKPDRKPFPLPYGLWNPYRNLKSEISQDYAQKPQRNCTVMNSASGIRSEADYFRLL